MTPQKRLLSRRNFVKASTLVPTAVVLGRVAVESPAESSSFSVKDLPKGGAPNPVATPHFHDRLEAFVWRNWTLVSIDRMAMVVGAERGDILRLGQAMGLKTPLPITRDQERRSYITVIRRNWHLLPYDQLLMLLGWTPEEMAYVLREDDFLYVKLGNLKPQCEPIKYSKPSSALEEHTQKINRVLKEEFPKGLPSQIEPLFQFVKDLSATPPSTSTEGKLGNPTTRYCYSYFALYGDPLLEPESDPYPDGYLARLAQSGVNGVWLQGVLQKLAPFPWDPQLSHRHQERLQNLGRLVTRARKHGIGVYLYLNEPRSMPLRFYEARPHLKGVVEGDHAALCTSDTSVQKFLQDSIAHICRAVPDLAGFFTITGSENLTNCWSHGSGAACPRCAKRTPAEVISQVNRLIVEGIQSSGSKGRLIAWDWGWSSAWAGDVIRQLPKEATLMSVSEWGIPINRGGVKTEIGEYSISTVGPGPRATSHWQIAREIGLNTFAKIQAGNTWELSAVPYIPALDNVARHATNLRGAGVNGLMLGWTLGGYPSPNLEVVAEVAGSPTITSDEALERVATRRFGKASATSVVTAWKSYSTAFSEFPFHGGLVYSAPLQAGPSNPLWEKPTHYQASMVGLPYDHLDAWRAVYPPEVFIGQLEKVSSGFETALSVLKASVSKLTLDPVFQKPLAKEMDVAEAAAIHFQSVANQARFVRARNQVIGTKDQAATHNLVTELEQILRSEITLAKRLLAIQSRDSRIGFEATNHYYYVPLDLVEKVVVCRDLLDRWLPSLK